MDTLGVCVNCEYVFQKFWLGTHVIVEEEPATVRGPDLSYYDDVESADDALAFRGFFNRPEPDRVEQPAHLAVAEGVAPDEADLPIRRARFVRKVLESEVGRRG